MPEKKDYTNFDRFIKSRIKDGTIYVNMPEKKLKEELRKLGIHRVKTYADDGKGYTNNAYPTKPQLDRVEDLIHRSQPRQEKIDKSEFYYKENRGRYRVKRGQIVYHNNKIYRGGRFLPRSYINE